MSETKVIELEKQPSQETPQQPKELPRISKGDFRKIMQKEVMLNGKTFENCSRFELFEMLMSTSKVIYNLQAEIRQLRAADKCGS